MDNTNANNVWLEMVNELEVKETGLYTLSNN